MIFPKKRLVVVAAGVLMVVGGLLASRCGREPGGHEEESRSGGSSRGHAASDLAKSGERLPSKKRTVEEVALAKIKFNLDEIRADGLRGPEDGLVSVSYEFCVPNDEQTLAEVRKLAPGVAIQAGAKGRIGCSDNEVLCIGSTHGPHWREILLGIAGLRYVAEIRECFFE